MANNWSENDLHGITKESEWLGELDIHGMYYLKNKNIEGKQNDELSIEKYWINVEKTKHLSKNKNYLQFVD